MQVRTVTKNDKRSYEYLTVKIKSKEENVDILNKYKNRIKSLYCHYTQYDEIPE